MWFVVGNIGLQPALCALLPGVRFDLRVLYLFARAEDSQFSPSAGALSQVATFGPLARVMARSTVISGVVFGICLRVIIVPVPLCRPDQRSNVCTNV